jgi:lambda family phage minor tail protein L
MSDLNVYQELLNSSPFAVIELFELRTFETMHGADETYYFHAGRNRKTTEPSSSDDILSAYSIYYNGHTYFPLPIEASGFEYKADGGLPRPTIRIANSNSSITSLLLSVNLITPGNDLNGAQVIRRRTLSRFLDGSNWEDGVNPYGTPSTSSAAQMPAETYYIDRKVTETRDFVEFELTSSLDLANARAPRRLVMQNLCQWVYRGRECGYTGTDDFTPQGRQVVTTPAANYTYGSGRDKLLAGSQLDNSEALVSTNGWFTAKMQKDGNFVVYKKPTPTIENYVWDTKSNRQIGDYSLVMQGDGNLVIYNNAVARDDYAGGSVVWSTDTWKVAVASGASLYKVNNQAQFISDGLATSAGGGRASGIGYELVGSSPTSGQVGQTTTAQKTFSHTSEVFGTRTITLTFTIRAGELSATHYSGESRGWVTFESVQFDSATGLFRDGETFEAKVSLGSSNPFRDNHPKVGTLTEAGVLVKIDTSAWRDKELRLQTDGNMVICDSDGSNITWTAGITPITSEPNVDETIIEGVAFPGDIAGQCGKTLADCKARFGASELPFGSFPSVGENN